MRQLLIGLAIAVPVTIAAVWFVVAHWKIALVGSVAVVVMLAAIVAAVVAALPLGYVVAAIYYALRPQQPSTATDYSIDQGREAGGPARGASEPKESE